MDVQTISMCGVAFVGAPAAVITVDHVASRIVGEARLPGVNLFLQLVVACLLSLLWNLYPPSIPDDWAEQVQMDCIAEQESDL